MTGTDAAPGPTLVVLAAVALLGAPLALRLPGRSGNPADAVKGSVPVP
jgi:hypothetical protein